MNRLTSLRSVQELNDGLHAVVRTDYEYASPDLLRFMVNGQSESIAVGGTQYYAENGSWISRPRVEPFVFPSFNNGQQAVRARVGRTEFLDGVPMQLVLADLNGSSPVHYAFWIDPDDGRLHQIAMVGPAHYMVQSYSDFNGPVSIQAPPAK
jgi:hypothetical protein